MSAIFVYVVLWWNWESCSLFPIESFSQWFSVVSVSECSAHKSLPMNFIFFPVDAICCLAWRNSFFYPVWFGIRILVWLFVISLLVWCFEFHFQKKKLAVYFLLLYSSLFHSLFFRLCSFFLLCFVWVFSVTIANCKFFFVYAFSSRHVICVLSSVIFSLGSSV